MIKFGTVLFAAILLSTYEIAYSLVDTGVTYFFLLNTILDDCVVIVVEVAKSNVEVLNLVIC